MSSSSIVAPCDDFRVYAMAENSANSRSLLHGDLELKISEAKALPNLSKYNRFLNYVSVGSHGNQERKHHVKRRPIDAYVTVSVPEATVARTRVIENAINPQWGEKFFVFLCHPVENLEFRLKVVKKTIGAKVKGEVKISAQRIATGELISEDFPLIRKNGKPYRDSALKIELKFTPFDQNPLYGQSIPNFPGHAGVGHTYFPLRKGCELRLYQDAHVPNGILPEIELEDRRVFRQHNCFEDICLAIAEAQRLIYIAGWSVSCKIKLVREPSRPLPLDGNWTLGELLKYKSAEGVRVLLLIWEDQPSCDKLGIKTSGVMQTHDEETRRFFEGSSVTCLVTPRCASKKLSPLKQSVLRTMFSNHQKCILVDTLAAGNYQKITAFLGGFDLSDGRYDTPEHRLFRDLDTVFKDDFRNSTLPSEIRAPRQPWHDLHCRIDGPAAYDVFLSFEQHWRQSADNDDALIRIERIAQILSPSLSVSPDGTTVVPVDNSRVRVSDDDDPESWHAQIFRSTDSGAAKGFPVYVDEAYGQNLVCSKGLVIDKSIQIAYIQAIRSAQHYIYIENQYFIGSSYAWPLYKGAGADNLIPIELALKIANKIKENERFAVYVIIPMYPEGDPKSETVQEILFWQYQTMQMMYDIIVKELRDMDRLDADPLDYLNFYCLGKRESIHEDNLAINGDKLSDSQRFGRFMIYVHPKAMIVDDEYVIIGSANINQRSMAGTKDIEIAMGAYQPYYTRKKGHPRGQVYGYRNSLWAEHLGTMNCHFEVPESRDCVRKVNEIATMNWKKFTAADFTPMQGHLLKYPIHVDKNGKVGPLRGYEKFPDVGGKVLGTYSHKFPDTLTT